MGRPSSSGTTGCDSSCSRRSRSREVTPDVSPYFLETWSREMVYEATRRNELVRRVARRVG